MHLTYAPGTHLRHSDVSKTTKYEFHTFTKGFPKMAWGMMVRDGSRGLPGIGVAPVRSVKISPLKVSIHAHVTISRKNAKLK